MVMPYYLLVLVFHLEQLMRGIKIETATPLAHKLLAECDFEEKDFTNDLGIASRIYQSAKKRNRFNRSFA